MSGRYVSTKTSIYTDPELRAWHPLTIYFYRYLYENDHAHGCAGMAEIDLGIMRAESKLTARQIERAKEQMGDKVVWFTEHSYWVVGRARHTCWTQEGNIHSKYAASARNHVNSLSKEKQDAFYKRYPELQKKGIANPSAIDWQSIPEPALTTRDKDRDRDKDKAVDGYFIKKSQKKGADAAAPPRDSKRKQKATAVKKTTNHDNDHDTDFPGEWTPELWNAVLKNTPKAWHARLQTGQSTVFSSRMSPAQVLATVLDVQYGDEKPKDVAEAVRWVLHRLGKHMDPNDTHHDQAKKLLRKGT